MTGVEGYLLDTDVLTDVRSEQPNPAVVAFLRSIAQSQVYVSALSVGELYVSVAGSAGNDPQSAAWQQWLEELPAHFNTRILPVDTDVAVLWGHYYAGPQRPFLETLLAATASAHQLTVVTGNTAVFLQLGIYAINPWKFVPVPQGSGQSVSA